VVKRFTISLAGSTSSSGAGLSLFFSFISPATYTNCCSACRSVRYIPEGLKTLLPHGLLQLADGKRIQQVILAIHPLVVRASDRKFGLELGDRTQRMFVLNLCFAGEDVQAKTVQADVCPQNKIRSTLC